MGLIEQRVAEQHGHDHRGAQLREHHKQPPVERVRQRPADQRDGEDRHELADPERTDRERRAGQVVHLERQRDEGDHRAEERHELPEEQQPELAAAQRGEVEEQAAHDR
jgi:hypothetical protein